MQLQLRKKARFPVLFTGWNGLVIDLVMCMLRSAVYGARGPYVSSHE
jgi:hypothetical protein